VLHISRSVSLVAPYWFAIRGVRLLGQMLHDSPPPKEIRDPTGPSLEIAGC